MSVRVWRRCAVTARASTFTPPKKISVFRSCCRRPPRRTSRAAKPGRNSPFNRGNVVRVLIVDDEMLARSILSEHLATLPDVEIVGEAANGFEAVKLAEELNPE